MPSPAAIVPFLRPARATAVMALAVAVAACASAPAPAPGAAQSPAQMAVELATDTAAPAGAPAAAGTPLPEVDLTSELLFRLVFAEIALQRGEPGPAYYELMNVARQTHDPRIAHRALEVALAARTLPQALDAAALWYHLAPQEPEAAQTYASLLVGNGRFDEARPLLEHQLALQPNPMDLLDRLQRVVAHGQAPAQGQALLQALGARYAADPATAFDAHVILARAARAAGDDEAAIAQSRAALAARPGTDLAAMTVAQLLVEGTTRPALAAEAVRVLEAHLDAHPEAADVRQVYARVLVNGGRLDEARAQFEELLRRAPQAPDPLFALGVLALEAEHYAQARGYFERYLAAVGTGPERDLDLVYLDMGRVAEGERRFDEALDWLRKVTGPEQAAVAREREAFILGRMNRVDEALQTLHALPSATDADRLQITLAEGQLLRDAHRYQASYDLLDQALAAHPDDASLLYEVAMSAERLDRVDVMEARLRRLLELRPDNAHAYNALGYSLADRNIRLQEAYQLIDHALHLAPDDGFIVDSLGWVQYRMGNLPAARDTLRRAFALKADPDVAAHLGEVLWATGDQSGARTLLLDAQKRDADSETLRDTLQRLKIQP